MRRAVLLTLDLLSFVLPSFAVAAYTPASRGIPLATALDSDRLAFVTGGDERWYGQTARHAI